MARDRVHNVSLMLNFENANKKGAIAVERN